MKLYDPLRHGPIIGDPEAPLRPDFPPPFLPRAGKQEEPVGPTFERFVSDGWLTRLARWVRASWAHLFRLEVEPVEPGDGESGRRPAVASVPGPLLGDSAVLVERHDSAQDAATESEASMPGLQADDRGGSKECSLSLQDWSRVSGYLMLASNPDHFKVLGVRPDSTDEEVRQAYLGLVKQLHPDRHPQPDVHDAATTAFMRVGVAFEALKCRAGRDAYAALAVPDFGGVKPYRLLCREYEDESELESLRRRLGHPETVFNELRTCRPTTLLRILRDPRTQIGVALSAAGCLPVRFMRELAEDPRVPAAIRRAAFRFVKPDDPEVH